MAKDTELSDKIIPSRASLRKGGKRRARRTLKGRQVEPAANDEVCTLLGTQPRRADLLIEFLHLIQDHYGHISAAHLAALAAEMRMAQAEVYEVASFYHHFDVVKEGEQPPANITIRICESLSCELAGAHELAEKLKKIAPEGVRVLKAPCMGRCQCAPVGVIGRRHIDHATVEKFINAVAHKTLEPNIPAYQSFAAYKAENGYDMLAKCRSGDIKVEQAIRVLSEAGLRGLGGAGFPAGKKWQFVRAEAGPRYVCINGDEGEPGTFKDRYYLESIPHQFLEGVLISAWGVEAKQAYIYLRDEYPAAREILTREIAVLEANGLIDKGFLHLRRGAGAYICGEESAMIESIEGKRGLPRHRPPYVAQRGLFGRPTLVNNIETVTWIGKILEHGAQWFIDQGKEGHPGFRSYSVSGRVKNPGVVVMPAGSTVRELIDHCGGMLEGHDFKGYLPGGASGGILPADKGDLPLDFGTLEKYGCLIGSHAVVVLSDKDNMKDVALNLLRFFEDESCGQCTPCRIGCEKAVQLMQAPKWNEGLLEELSQAMVDASICGLGQAAPNPIKSVIRYFRDDLA